MESYEYQSIALTCSIICKLILKLFDGKQVKRDEINGVITKYHLDNGGGETTRDIKALIREALNKLTKNHKLINNSGTLHISSEGIFAIDSKVTKQTEDNKNNPGNEIIIETKNKAITITPERVIGKGNQSVYIYYYRDNKEQAESNGEDCWYFYISSNIYEKVFYYEKPNIALTIQTDCAADIENIIITTLRRWGEKQTDTGWFLTNIKRIEEIYTFNFCHNIELTQVS